MPFLVALTLLAFLQADDVERLLKQLASPDSRESSAAMTALIERGEKVEARVKELKETATGGARILCDMILRNFESKRRLPAIVPPYKLVTLESKGEPLWSVLSRFTSQVGWPSIEITGDLQQKKVTVSVKDATPLEALDEICRSI